MSNSKHDVVALSIPYDIHTSAVKLGLREYGTELIPLYFSSFPYNSTIEFGTNAEGRSHLDIDGMNLITGSRPFVLWGRRRGLIQPLEGVDPKDEKVAADHLNRLVESIAFDLSSRAILAVNDQRFFQPTELSKLLQLSMASHIGLNLPETLITNSPDRIHEFFNTSDGPFVGKSLGPAVWREDGTTHLSVTAFITEAGLPSDNLLRSAPVILQKAVPKAYEIRANVMGSFVQAVRIDSPDPNGEHIDWRVNQNDNKVSPINLPHQVEEKLVALMRSLNLVFGAVDLIVQPDGTHVFLEVNQMGQFLWVEEQCPEVHVLDAFCQFLCSASVDFTGPVHPPKVFFPEIRAAAWKWSKADGDRRGFSLEEFEKRHPY